MVLLGTLPYLGQCWYSESLYWESIGFESEKLEQESQLCLLHEASNTQTTGFFILQLMVMKTVIMISWNCCED